MLEVHQIRDMDQEKTKCREELIQQLLHQLILSEENREWIVAKDLQLQIKHKSSLTEDLKTKDSQDKEVLMLITKCLQSAIKDPCNHKMRYLLFQSDLIPVKITNLCRQKEQVQETQLVDNQLK